MNTTNDKLEELWVSVYILTVALDSIINLCDEINISGNKAEIFYKAINQCNSFFKCFTRCDILEMGGIKNV